MHGRERRLVRLWRYTKFKPTLNSRPWSPYVISHPQARPTNQIWVHNGLNPQQFPPGQNFIHEYHPFRDASSTPALAARFLVLSSGWDLDEVWMKVWCKRDEAWGLCSSRFLEEDDEWMNIIQVWPFFSIWIGLVYCLECVVGPFLSSGRAERPTIFDLLRQSCGRGYDSCWWGWGVGGVFPQNNWIEIFLGFAFCWSRLGEVLCNLLRRKGREFERILKLVGEFFLQGTSSGPERAGKSYLIFLVSAIFCEGRKCSEVREVAVLRMVSSMALQEGVRSWHVWRQPMVIVTFVSVPLKDAQEGRFENSYCSLHIGVV